VEGPVNGTYEFAYRLRAAARRPASWLQLLKFGIVGGSGYLINLAVFAVLAGGLGVHHLLAAIGAFCIALANNFLWNRHWTFEAGHGHPGFQAARFFAVSVAALLINLVVLELLVSSASMGDLAAQAIAVAVAMPFNFLGNKLWTFA
jgi:dolichol-phosphate mannosyltransferase